jgi:type I restriction enzyme S subunit
MQDKVYTYLKFVRYRNIENWSVQYAINSRLHFGEKYELVRIGAFLSRNKTPIIVEDDKYYKRVTIKTNNGGCCLRDKIIGKQIGTKLQFLISEGQFILSKIDARNGAMGVVPKECDNAIITGNFWTFDVNSELVDSNYLSLVTTTKEFISFAETASNGTTNRHYLQEPLFLDVKIPLPTLKKQQALVEAYKNKIQQAAKQESQAVEVEHSIEDYLLSELGIKPQAYTLPEPSTIASEPQIEYAINQGQDVDNSVTYHWGDKIKKEYKYLKFVKFKDVTEWGYDRLIGNNRNLLHSTIFQNKALASLLEINPKTSFSKLHDDDNISFIPMECISDEYGEWKEKRICKIALSKGYTKFMSGDLIWARITPCMQNGKSAIVDDLENGYGCGSTEFHILRNHNGDLNMHYVHALLRLPLVLKDAMKSFTGSAGQQRVPKSYLENLTIPVPSMDVQNAIIEYINNQKSKIKELKQQSEALRKEAFEEFEKEIFE